MKVLLANSLFPDLGIGGAELSTYHLARGLQAIGHDVLVFSQNVDDRTIDESKDGVSVIRAASKPGTGPNIFDDTYYTRLAKAAREPYPLDKQLAEVVRRFKPDVVNTAVIGRLTLLWTMIKQHDVACVHTLRSYSSLCHRRMIVGDAPCLRQCRDCAATRVGARERSGMVDGVIGISSHVLATHLRSGWFRGTPNRTVIGNGYDLVPSAPEEEAAAGEALYEFGYIGRLHHTKGVELFLEAIQALRAATGRPHRTMIAGTGSPAFEWRLRNRFEDAETNFVGYISPSTFFRRVRFCVVPSIWFEPFGRTFIESLRHGVPVLGSRRGGGAEILADGRTGWLFEPTVPALKDAMALASAIDDEAYGRVRRAALVSAEDYTSTAIARRYEAFYETVRGTAR